MSDATRILITDGGPHPPSLWAETTVSQIVSGTSAEADTLRSALVPLLLDAHTLVQSSERSGKRAPRDIVAKTVVALVTATRNTPHADHFARAETQDYLCRLLSEHFATVADIERRYAADRAASSRE